jgi:hypothetical protein
MRTIRNILRAAILVFTIVLETMTNQITQAQVSIKERVTIDPSRSGTRRTFSSGIGSYAPCDPYFPQQFVPPSTYQYVVFHNGDWQLAIPLPDNSSWWWLNEIDGNEYASIWYQNAPISAPFYFYVPPSLQLDPFAAEPESTAVVSLALVGQSYMQAYTVNYYVVRAKYHIGSQVWKRHVTFRDSSNIDVDALNQCGKMNPQAPDTLSYTASIVQGMNYGTLLDPTTGVSGKVITALHRGAGIGLRFLANCDNPDGYGMVRFTFTTSDPRIPGSVDSITVDAGASGPVVKYRITLSPDSLLHGDTTVVTVAAVDSNNQLQLWPDTTHLTFTLDSTRYARFISPTGDSVQSPLRSVLYSDAKVGKVKVVADGVRPSLPGPKQIRCTVSDGNKSGISTIFIKPLTIRLTAARPFLRPLRDGDNVNRTPTPSDKRLKLIDTTKVDTTKVTVTIRDGQGTPVPNYSFWLQTYVVDQSGGHAHIPRRPLGKLVSARNDTAYKLKLTTQTDGKVIVTYLNSGFGGLDSIQARGHSAADTGNISIPVKDSTLVIYNGSQHMTLVGTTTRHPLNHYAKPATIDAVNRLADSIYAYSSSWKLRCNDMSLINGGPFDCDTAVIKDWNTPHQLHRQGVSIDIGYKATNGTTIIDSTRLADVWFRINPLGSVQYEGDPKHYHVNFKVSQ